jgi:hypothetical protein
VKKPSESSGALSSHAGTNLWKYDGDEVRNSHQHFHQTPMNLREKNLLYVFQVFDLPATKNSLSVYPKSIDQLDQDLTIVLSEISIRRHVPQLSLDLNSLRSIPLAQTSSSNLSTATSSVFSTLEDRFVGREKMRGDSDGMKTPLSEGGSRSGSFVDLNKLRSEMELMETRRFEGLDQKVVIDFSRIGL